MRVELLAPGAPAWADVLRRAPHDFHHLPAYAEVAARHEGGEPVAALVRDGDARLLQPLVLRRIEGAVDLDAVTPYGYAGPLWCASSPAFVRDGTAALVEALRARGLVSMFVRLHPVLDPGPSVAHAVGAVVRHADTVSIDLRLPADAMWRLTRAGHRNAINRARRRGDRVRLDPEWRRLLQFAGFYRDAMRRVGAGRGYLFGDDYFLGLRRALGAHGHFAVVEIAGEVAAAGIFSEVDGLVQWHLSADDPRFRSEQPTKTLLHHMRIWGHERGHHTLHLGGGIGAEEDMVHRFKTGFSPQRHPFHTWRVVIDRERYRELCAARGVEADERSFFPAYRA